MCLEGMQAVCQTPCSQLSRNSPSSFSAWRFDRPMLSHCVRFCCRVPETGHCTDPQSHRTCRLCQSKTPERQPFNPLRRPQTYGRTPLRCSARCRLRDRPHALDGCAALPDALSALAPMRTLPSELMMHVSAVALVCFTRSVRQSLLGRPGPRRTSVALGEHQEESASRVRACWSRAISLLGALKTSD